jgi:LPPG:FO 2-phospho-L-lactate transferase
MTANDLHHPGYLALSGGVGGAKLALGLSHILPPEQLTLVVNTADDFVHLGLNISPDLDTLMYTLAGIVNRERGWGLETETWHAMEALKRLGGESWFRLGDGDLATHLQRGELLRSGLSLTEATRELALSLGVKQKILPMSDHIVQTMVNTTEGEMAFQEYFVREECRPKVTGFRFAGIDKAEPQSDWMEMLSDINLKAVIICPSNPFVSVEPMLQLRGLRAALVACKAPVIAVSPIVGGAAIKGPAAKMMAELNMPVTASAVAEYYGDILDGFVIDERDADLVDHIPGGVRSLVVPTIMRTLEDRKDLAQKVVAFADQLRDSR